jgi:hypothetical protein
MYLLIDRKCESDANNIIIGFEVKEDIQLGTNAMIYTNPIQNENKY